MKLKLKSLALSALILAGIGACRSRQAEEPTTAEKIESNPRGEGQTITFAFEKGSGHNHPTFALWLEDAEGNFIQTLFVTRSIATGIFDRVEISNGQWQPGQAKRPSALPYWSHQRGIMDDEGYYLPSPASPVVDAYSGATPLSNFVLTTRSDKALPQKFRILFEVNQTWDWNEYWTNEKYPENPHYKASCQPSVVYSVQVDLTDKLPKYHLNPIGHGHFSGEDGRLYTDLGTLTTALAIMSRGVISIE